MQHPPVVIERLLKAPIARVWQALTDNEQLQEWYFKLAAFNAVEGFQFRFTGGPSEDRQYVHLCTVTAVQPPTRLAYTWQYGGIPGNTEVTFQLTEKEDGTVLRLTHTGLETFPKESPDLAKKNFAEGWTSIINEALAPYVEAKES